MSTGRELAELRARSTPRGRPGSRSAARTRASRRGSGPRSGPRGRRSSSTPSSSAVSWSSPTAFASANGVGANAIRPCFSNSACGLVDGLLGVAGHVLGRQPEERRQRRRGVLGIAADLAVLERLQGDLLGAEVEVGRDVVAGGLERLGVDLAEDELLGEVLGPDRELRPRCCRGSPRSGWPLVSPLRRRWSCSSSSPQAASASASTSAASSANSSAQRELVLIWVVPLSRWTLGRVTPRSLRPVNPMQMPVGERGAAERSPRGVSSRWIPARPSSNGERQERHQDRARDRPPRRRRRCVAEDAARRGCRRPRASRSSRWRRC